MASTAKIDKWHNSAGFARNQVVQVRQTVLTEEYSLARSNVEVWDQQNDDTRYVYQRTSNGISNQQISSPNSPLSTNESPTPATDRGWIVVPNYTVTITPKLRGSKFLIMVDLICGSSYWELQAKLQRNGTDLATGSGASLRTPVTMQDNNYEYTPTAQYSQYSTYKMYTTLLDDPFAGGGYGREDVISTGSNRDTYDSATGQAPIINPYEPLTYSVLINSYQSNTIHINRPQYANHDSDYWGSPISTITVMEISA